MCRTPRARIGLLTVARHRSYPGLTSLLMRSACSVWRSMCAQASSMVRKGACRLSHCGGAEGGTLLTACYTNQIPSNLLYAREKTLIVQ